MREFLDQLAREVEDEDQMSVFRLVGGPCPRPKAGRKKERDLLDSGVAAVRILDDGAPVTLELLAAVAGVDVSVMCRRCQAARETMRAHPEKYTRVGGADLRYFMKRYMNSDDPVAREFSQGLNGRRRKRA